MKINSTKLDVAMANACITTNELSNKANLNYSTLTRIKSGSHANPATIGKIAKALNVKVTVTFECENTTPGRVKEYTFAPWNVKYKSNHFYLDNPILWFFDKEKGCYEDSVAFTLACMKALAEKGIDVDYAWFYNPAELANKLMKVYPFTHIEY